MPALKTVIDEKGKSFLPNDYLTSIFKIFYINTMDILLTH